MPLGGLNVARDTQRYRQSRFRPRKVPTCGHPASHATLCQKIRRYPIPLLNPCSAPLGILRTEHGSGELKEIEPDPPVVDEVPVKRNPLSSLDGYLTAWIFEAMAARVLLGWLTPDVVPFLNRLQRRHNFDSDCHRTVLMMYPPFMCPTYKELHEVFVSCIFRSTPANSSSN
jgi:hypothetical protein